MIKVSVIVAVYNPGRHLQAPVDSFLRQTLPSDEFEVIFVDDGSTDGSGPRLDRLEAQHPHFSVIHIPNSGWPGRPRNLGIDAATGRYVLFVDHDDWLEDDALAYLWDVAETNDADVVAAREVGHGFRVPPRMFRRTIPDAKLGTDEILALLTPHKLFRRSMLVEHGIRFPEGPRRLEDHDFVMQAYFAARRITVTGDHPVYHWARREEGGNATGRSFTREQYYRNLRDVLDIVDAHTEPGELRDRLYAHWLHFKLVHKLMLRLHVPEPGPDARRLYAEVRALMAERFAPSVDRHLPVGYRLVARMVREDRLDLVSSAARYANGLSLDARLLRIDAASSPASLEVAFALRDPDGAPMGLERSADGRRLWRPPPGLVEGLDLDPTDLDVTDELAGTELALVLRQRGTDLEHDAVIPLPASDELAGNVVLGADPATFAAGSPLPDGTWDALLQVEFGGFRVSRRLDARDAELRGVDGFRATRTATGTLAFTARRGVPGMRRPPTITGPRGAGGPAGTARRIARRWLPAPARRAARELAGRLRR